MRQLAVLCDLVVKTAKQKPKPAKLAAQEEEASRLGFRHLSQEIDPVRLFEAKEPFEVELDLGEPSGREIDFVSDRMAAVEAWRSNGQFRVSPGCMKQRETATKQRELVIPVEALWDGNVFRAFDLVVHPSLDGKLHVASERIRDMSVSGADFLTAFETFDTLDAELGPKAFVIRFDSGHVLNGERLYLPMPPTALFRDWKWVKFGKPGYDVTKEKPKKWTVMRSCRNFENVKSDSANDLFSFLVKNVETWEPLASRAEWYALCHDQPQEVADFVVLVPSDRLMAHIHVKGAKSGDRNRRVAIGAYDLVVTQAIKNLPRLDVGTLLATLEKGPSSDHEAGQFVVYKNGKDVKKDMDCAPFMTALRKMTSWPLLARKVVIFQPHGRASLWLPKVDEWDSSIDRLSIPEIQPVLMLSSLLLDAKIACMRVDAEFSVWGTWDFPSGRNPVTPVHDSPFLAAE